jgi:hypothetical protein
VGAEQLVAGRYRLVRQVGSGGMGVVWQAYDERLHRKVAVKQLLMPAELTGPQTAQARKLAMREGRIAAKLQHPQAITVYDVLEADGQSYLIMEYLPSTSLAQVLAERGPLPPREVAGIGAQLADALAAAHAAGVVHRDVKPGNVLLGPDGTVKITDFGISRAVEDVTATVTGLIAGTPAYLSPEVAQGQPATYRSDVFSLGATLYAAVEGRPPAGTADNAMAVLYRAASGDLDPPTRAGPITESLLEMLSPDPARRPTMAVVRDRLERLADPPPAPGALPAPVATPVAPVVPDAPRVRPPTEIIEHTTADPPAPAVNRTRRTRLAVILAATLGLAGAIVALVLTAGRDGGTAAPGPPSSAAPATAAGSSAPSGSTGATAPPGQVSPPARNTSSAPAGPPPNTAAPQANARQSAAGTIAGYYALMPRDLQQTWSWLTPKYQQHPAGGYGGYQTFWGRINTVRVSQVNAIDGNTVEATVEYSFKDGKVVRERHRYTLINQDGAWMIDQSVVLSSQTL